MLYFLDGNGIGGPQPQSRAGRQVSGTRDGQGVWHAPAIGFRIAGFRRVGPLSPGLAQRGRLPDDVPENNSLCVLNEAEFQLYDLYPNPTSGKLNLTLLIPDNGNIVIRVFDNAGRLVYNKDYELTKGYRQITLNCSEFTQGKYMLNISYKGKTEVRNFVLE